MVFPHLPMPPNGSCVVQMYGYVDTAGVRGAGGRQVRTPVLMHCGAPAAVPFEPDIYAIVAQYGTPKEKAMLPNRGDDWLAATLRKTFGFMAGMHQQMCTECAALRERCMTRRSSQGGIGILAHLVEFMGGDSGAAEGDIPAGLGARAGGGDRVDPLARVRRSEGNWPRTVASIGPQQLPGHEAVQRAVDSAVRTPPRAWLPSDDITDVYSGAPASMGDFGALDPNIRRGGMYSLPRQLGVLTGETRADSEAFCIDVNMPCRLHVCRRRHGCARAARATPWRRWRLQWRMRAGLRLVRSKAPARLS